MRKVLENSKSNKNTYNTEDTAKTVQFSARTYCNYLTHKCPGQHNKQSEHQTQNSCNTPRYKKKALDRVWHNELTFKLLAMEVPHQLVTYLRILPPQNISSKSKRISVNIQNNKSKSFTRFELLPILVSVYINNNMPAYPQAKAVLFADDTIFYASS